jgi:hypothetical protein
LFDYPPITVTKWDPDHDIGNGMTYEGLMKKMKKVEDSANFEFNLGSAGRFDFKAYVDPTNGTNGVVKETDETNNWGYLNNKRAWKQNKQYKILVIAVKDLTDDTKVDDGLIEEMHKQMALIMAGYPFDPAVTKVQMSMKPETKILYYPNLIDTPVGKRNARMIINTELEMVRRANKADLLVAILMDDELWLDEAGENHNMLPGLWPFKILLLNRDSDIETAAHELGHAYGEGHKFRVFWQNGWCFDQYKDIKVCDGIPGSSMPPDIVFEGNSPRINIYTSKDGSLYEHPFRDKPELDIYPDASVGLRYHDIMTQPHKQGAFYINVWPDSSTYGAVQQGIKSFFEVPE